MHHLFVFNIIGLLHDFTLYFIPIISQDLNSCRFFILQLSKENLYLNKSVIDTYCLVYIQNCLSVLNQNVFYNFTHLSSLRFNKYSCHYSKCKSDFLWMNLLNSFSESLISFPQHIYHPKCQEKSKGMCSFLLFVFDEIIIDYFDLQDKRLTSLELNLRCLWISPWHSTFETNIILV